MNIEDQKEQSRKQDEAGRKPKQESRAIEFRQRLMAWKQTPESSRPSLRALARELGTTHQLLSHYLAGLEEWRRERDLEPFRVNAKARNIPLTPGLENRYIAWLRKIEARQARDAAKYGPQLLKFQKRFEKLGGLEGLLKRIPNRWPNGR